VSALLRCGAALAGLALSGCAEQYVLPAGAETARLKISRHAWICNDNKRAMLSSEGDYAAIPASRRITVGANHSWQGYNVTYSCAPRVSFVPVGGASYYQDVEVEGERCTAFVYREVTTNPIGLDFMPTMDRGQGC
jgi:hypothetical protein